MNESPWKKTLFAVWAGTFLALMGFSTSIPIIPFYLQDLGVKDPTSLKFLTGLNQSLPAVTMAIMAPIWGSLADAIGRKPMLLRSLFGGAVVMILQGLAQDPWQLLALRTFQGCLTGTVAAATVLIASIAPDEEIGYSLGLLQMSNFLGASLGPMFGGLISEWFGYRVNFFATATILVAAGFIVANFAEENFSPPAVRKSILKSLKPDFSPLTSSRALWALLAAVAVNQIAGTIVSPFLPLFIQSISADSAGVASNTGLVLGMSALASAAAAVFIGKISFRFGYERTLVVCMIGAAIFSIPQAFVDSPTQLLVLRMAGGFFIGGTMPSANALIALRTDSDKRGSIYGLRSSVAAGASSLGPVIGASIAAAFGYNSVFLATGAILAACGLWILSFTRRKP